MNKITIGMMEPIQRWESHWHPMGIMYISAYLEKYNYRNYLINKALFDEDISDLNSIEIENLILNKIDELKIDLLGITCAVNEINYVYSFCKKIKKRFPYIKVMVGGPMPTSKPELFLRDDTIDFVVRGEGEKTVLGLVKCLENNESLDNVRGISYRKNTKIAHNEEQPLIEDIDSIPQPAYEKVNMEQYTSMHEWVIRGFPIKGIFVLTSRGCPFKCTFCGASTIHGRRVRFRSSENLYIELKFLRDNYGIEGIFFADDTFLLNRKHVLDICQVMKELNLLWSCFSRVDTIKEDLLKIMKASGCIQLDFGIESGSDRVLRDIMKKGTNVAQAKAAFALCEKYKMRTFANLMIGLPTETQQEMYQTFNLAKELHAYTYVLSIAMPLPNTELWNMVNPDIGIDELDKLNWNGDDFELTDRCNRSLIPTEKLIYLYHYFTRKLRKIAVLKTLKNYHRYLLDFMRLGNKFERFKIEIMYLLKQNITILRIYLFLSSRFKLVKKINRFIKS